MPEVPFAGEDHGNVALVRCLDDLSVADGAAGLDDRGDAGVREEVEAVAEGEEGVGGGVGAGGRQDRFHDRDFGGVDAAHLSGSDADGLIAIGEDDRIRLHVRADDPGEFERFEILGGWLPSSYYLPSLP